MREDTTIPHPVPRRDISSRLMALVVLLILGCGVIGESTPRSAQGADDQAAADKKEKQEQTEDSSLEPPKDPFPRKLKSPSLDGGVDWLNTSGEIDIKDLRGKVVILDFWTYCCINCMHILPDLKFLEHKYPNELVVIGVHSAKFDNEKESENIRRAIVRYEIEHPVVNDANMTIWRKFGVSSWPTIALIDPEGNFCGVASGEGNRELLDDAVSRLIEFHKSKGTLDETPVEFSLERSRIKGGPLKFPGKLLADEAGGRLFISDSNHNRIVIADLEGNLLDVIGTGAIGSENGNYTTATFDHPQGMALSGDVLYIADTENHLLRAVDLKSKTVSTIAGTGKQASFRSPGGEASVTALNSPWDLLVVGKKLYIAMAGPHQLWSLDLESNRTEPYAGSGREDIRNGTLDSCALAQPSGIVTDGTYLYVVDSEGSAVRQIPLDSDGKVTTIVGTSDLPGGRALFEFGDIDGTGDEVRLQHPLGIALKDGTLYVADSYNHKIKQVDIKEKTSKTFLGTGEPGQEVNPPQLSEPAGLAVVGDKLYIADTNNHRILVSNLSTKETSELEIKGLTPPSPPETSGKEPDPEAVVAMDAQSIKAGEAVQFELNLPLPEGYKLNPESPVIYRIRVEGDQTLLKPEELNERREASVKEGKATFTAQLAPGMGKGDLMIDVTYGYCRDGVGGLCKLGKLRWKVPVEATADATQTSITLTSPEVK